MVPIVPTMDGNTDTSIASKDSSSPKYVWDFVLNNWSEEEYCSIINVCKDIGKKYIIAKEVGDKNGTPHLQCYISLKKKLRKKQLIELFGKRVSFRPARNEKALINYCKEDGDYVQYGFPKPIKIITELRPWQKKIEDIFFTEPNGRSVHWYWEYTGGVGKSAFCKYMYVKNNALVIQGGKLADIMNIIFNYNMDDCNMIIIDVPRNNGNKISYNAVECILNGMITNTKYETGVKVFNPPHVVVFSNYEPDYSLLSEDRWIVECIGEPCPSIDTSVLD